MQLQLHYARTIALCPPLCELFRLLLRVEGMHIRRSNVAHVPATVLSGRHTENRYSHACDSSAAARRPLSQGACQIPLASAGGDPGRENGRYAPFSRGVQPSQRRDFNGYAEIASTGLRVHRRAPASRDQKHVAECRHSVPAATHYDNRLPERGSPWQPVEPSDRQAAKTKPPGKFWYRTTPPERSCTVCEGNRD